MGKKYLMDNLINEFLTMPDLFEKCIFDSQHEELQVQFIEQNFL